MTQDLLSTGHRTGAPHWTDSHCHLQDAPEVEVLVERALGANVDRMVCIGTGPESSRRAQDLALQQAAQGLSVWATVGQHPHDADAGVEEIRALLHEINPASHREVGAGQRLPSGSVVAVGECGLDYHYDYSDRAAQRESFAAQIELASTHDLALVVHTREAWDDTFAILEAPGRPDRVVIHCFTGGPDEARRCLDLGAYLSFSGIVTFKNASDVREALQICPSDRLLVETDAPYLAPVPHRGTPNEPAYVAIVGAAIAQLKGLTEVEVSTVTSANAASVFSLAV